MSQKQTHKRQESNRYGDERALKSKVAIVTGGASGIGRATAHALARAGAHVVVVDVSTQHIDDTLAELNELTNPQDALRDTTLSETGAGAAGEAPGHLGLALDVRDEDAMNAMAQQTLDRFGRIDILVASAGILRGRGCSPRPLVHISTSEWQEVLDTNLKGMFLSNRAVLGTMIKQRCGDIINISSVSGKQGRAHDAPYCASKFGVIGMSEALAEEVRLQGVRVQIVIPDAVKTAIWQQNGPVPCPSDALAPERVADLILFMVTQPRDTMLVGVTIAPFRSRRRRPSSKKVAATQDQRPEPVPSRTLPLEQHRDAIRTPDCSDEERRFSL